MYIYVYLYVYIYVYMHIYIHIYARGVHGTIFLSLFMFFSSLSCVYTPTKLRGTPSWELLLTVTNYQI